MSMPHVHLFEPVVNYGNDCPISDKITPFSSRSTAIGHCRGEFDKPDFEGDKTFTTVSVNGSVVGWITKKPVQ